VDLSFVAARMREATKQVEVKSPTPVAPSIGGIGRTMSTNRHTRRSSVGASKESTTTPISNLAATSSDIVFISTNQRRPRRLELGVKGEMLVLLRDGFTDMLDFIAIRN
jgi:methionine synthase I (cobalamin-dependent)